MSPTLGMLLSIGWRVESLVAMPYLEAGSRGTVKKTELYALPSCRLHMVPDAFPDRVFVVRFDEVRGALAP